MTELENLACDAAGNLLDMFLGTLGPNPQDAEIEKATKRYIAAVLTPLFEPIATMPKAERGQIIALMVLSIREMTRTIAEITLNHPEPQNDQ